ncbi:AMP-binding protein [Saccharicrinis sp. GN24d3]|uniref:AMP-binding protein n=1 Tax=Saccharicrinis sp. GN24d3 TaxID=3458416 RepID=UPI0040356F0E
MKEKHPIVKAIAQFIFFVGRFMLSLRYKVKLSNLDVIDKGRPVLFLPNHQAVVDPMLLVSFIYPHKNVVPVVTSTYYDLPVLNKFFKNWGAVRVSDLEAGSRNVNVLNEIIQSATRAFEHKRSIVIYPSGQIAGQGLERILNKKSAFEIVKNLPDDVQIVGVRISGLWGSMWSKAWTGKSPEFVSSVFKGIGYILVNLVFFSPRRKVSIAFEDITAECRQKAIGADRKEFNSYLEGFYNEKGVEEPSFVKHYFFQQSGRGVPQKNVGVDPASSMISTQKISFPFAIEKGVDKIVAQKLEVNISTFSAESKLVNDLGADSLGIVEIIEEIEKKFKVDTVTEIAGFNRVGDLYLLANGDLQKQVELPPCSFGKQSPFSNYIKVKSLNNIPAQFIERFSSNKYLPFAYDAMLGESTRKDFLLKACVVAEIIKKKCRTERIGIMLPALQSTSLLVMACYLAGKVPVMLNWTVGKKILGYCVKEADIKQIFTATAFVDKIKDKLPTSVIEKLVMMEKEVKNAGFGVKLTGLIKSKLPKILIDPEDCSDIAVILFTSGSESLPKAVPLTHGNIVNDLKSTMDSVNISMNAVLMGILPPFHSFGFSVLSILPLITGVRIAYYPDPTDGKGVVRSIHHTKASLLVTAPSFLKIILSHAHRHELDSIEYVVSGSEALSKDIREHFEHMLPKATMIEGYGITECSPVLSLNPLEKQKEGSVGKVIKNVECRITDLETEQVVENNMEGMICFKGKNVFNGYLNVDLETPFVEIEDEVYYKTGDLGYLDDEGYLFITGRLKRFIKSAGEMISLPFIENILLSRFGEEEEKVLAVEGSDEGKVPQIVLYTTKPIGIKEANECLRENNAPPIAKITRVELLESIPLLGTGKVDYKVLKEMVVDNGNK